MASDPYLMVGLGNPGTKYHGTRHNIGFEVIDAFAQENNADLAVEKWDCLTGKVKLGETTVHLVKPMTYMNLSGKAVVRFMDFFKIPIAKIIVVHDDLDMKPGRIKLVAGGGTGGHNGIRSIVSHLGTNGFYRLKIGIGRPGAGNAHAEIPVDRYVLSSFQEDEINVIQSRIVEMLKGLEQFFAGEVSGAMNFLNSFK